MRILVFADVWFPDTTGGAGRMATQSSIELARMGHEVHAVTRNAGSTLPAQETLDSGVVVHRFACPGSGAGLARRMAAELGGSLRTVAGLSPRDFDVAVIHQSLPAFAPWLAGMLRGVPSVYYFHSPWHEEYLIRAAARGGVDLADRVVAWLMRAMERALVRRSCRVVVLSDYMRGRLVEAHRPDQDRVVGIPGGVDMSRFRLPEGGRDGARERLRLPGGRTLFLTVRNLAPRMGLETFVEAFAGSALLRERAMGVIGGRGLLEESLWALVRDGGLEDCIRFWGFVDEEQLPDLYGAADWFVLPTRLLEGFGLVIPEAWACGTPVLGTPQGAIPDILSAVDPNHVFDGLDAQALRRKMEDVVRRPQEYRHDPQALREHAAGRFAWSMVAGAFEEVVRGAVEGGPLRSGG